MPLVDDGYAALGDFRRGVNEGDLTCQVFLNARPSRERRDPWYRISMTRELADRLADAARQSLSDVEARAADQDLLAEFDFDAMLDGNLGVLSTRDTPGIGNWFDELPRADWPQVFQGDEQTLSRARYYAFRLVLPDGRTVRAFRGKAGLEIAARKRNAVAAAFQRDTQEMIPIDTAVITFDQSVDFFDWDGLVFIANMRTFESITNIREVTIRKAVDAVDALAARFDLGDLNALKAQVEKRTRLGKRLAAAHKHGLVADIDAKVATQLIEARQLRFQCEDGGDQVRFVIDHADAGAVEDFVDFVSDVFLVSPTTRRDWEALAKRPPRRR